MGTMKEEVATQSQCNREEKVVVLVRVRPLNDKEIARNDVSDWECINDDTIIFKNNLSVSERSMYPTAYSFDRVFRPNCSTRKVYEEGAKDVALSVVGGVNASVFAYGPTSSGKTYTMSGITEYAVAEIYDHIERHSERAFLLKFSAMEIYNESVRDLLSMDSTPLRLLDDPERGTVVERLTEETLRDRSHLQDLLSVCEAQRQIGETSLNETSSRSHQILRLTIESSNRESLGNDNSSTLAATVNFVDLAGSERASQTLSAGTRLKEGCHINRSLLTLGTVIRKLSKGRTGHIPFRDSKLTRILQSSLGGNAKSCIICTMSPARSHVEQSRNTLLFGTCAKEVITNAQVNIVVSDKALVKHLQREVARLEGELSTSLTSSITPNSVALLRDKDAEIQKLKDEVIALTLQLNHAQSQIQVLQQVENTRPSMTWEGSDRHCTKFPAEKPCADEHSGSQGYSFYSSCHSRSNSNEKCEPPFHEENSMPDHTVQQRIDSTHMIIRSPSYQEQWEIEERSVGNSEDFCKEVQCIEIKSSSPTNYTSSDGGDTGVTFRYSERVNQELLSVPDQVMEYKELSCIHPSCGVPLPEEQEEDRNLNCAQPAFLVNPPEEVTPKNSKKDIFNPEMKLSRSKSCNARLIPTESLSSHQNLDNEHTPPDESIKEFFGRPKSFQIERPLLRYDIGGEEVSRTCSRTSGSSSAAEELGYQDDRTSTDENVDSKSLVLKELTIECDNLQEYMEKEPMINVSTKNVRDIGLDPIPGDLGSPLLWPAEFRRLQREIIQLWHDCNVSLIYRTLFYSIFRGDPADSIYIEVELRRLSYLHDTFSRGNQTIENGRPLTHASRTKSLCREREMLSKKMLKRLSVEDRESLYLKWGVGLRTKHRRLQLAYRFWTDVEDMDHIAESAAVIARLVGFIDQGHALKEMFGLNFTPQRTRTRFYARNKSVIPPLKAVS